MANGLEFRQHLQSSDGSKLSTFTHSHIHTMVAQAAMQGADL